MSYDAFRIPRMIADKLENLTRQILNETPLSRADADWIVDHVHEADLPSLFQSASRIRDRFFGRDVHCCSIVAAKVGMCDQDCAFCSQSAHYETHVKGESTVPAEQVYRACREAAANGVRCFGIVNSGLGPSDEEIEAWGKTFRRIRANGDVGLCASLGVLTQEQAFRLAELGVERYNHNLQTSRRYHPRITTTHTYDDRLATLRHLKVAGIELCCGGLFGMGESWADRLDLAFDLRDLDPHVVPINFLIPMAGTPLADTAPLPPAECLKIIAVFRHILPHQDIKIAGGAGAAAGPAAGSPFRGRGQRISHGQLSHVMRPVPGGRSPDAGGPRAEHGSLFTGRRPSLWFERRRGQPRTRPGLPG